MRNISKKYYIVGIIVLLVFAGAWYLFIYEPPYDGPIQVTGHTLVFGHRGGGFYAPDNSLQGAEWSMSIGMDGVDMDANITSDGYIVIFHDLTVDRLTTSTGPVTSKTLKEMLSLDLAPKYKAGTSGAYVETFEDFVKNISPKGILMVELKVPGLANTGIEQKAVSIIEKYNAYDHVYLSSFNPVVLWRVKHIDPRVHTVFIFMDTDWNAQLLAEMDPKDKVDLPWFLQNELIRTAIRKIIKPDLLSVNIAVATSTIDKLENAGWPIFLWTPETKDEITQALSFHPYGVISDEPQMLKDLRDAQ
ncbi:MAG TPA: glycerophosphodiester phosphodiesterase family protein [Candidatus Paceibacterota bacterium]|nr:glycerophosphodiester phosphodiesterase family protein [Candidatus Paceibacterota bacterium]